MRRGGHNYFELIHILFSPLFIASWSWMGVYKILCKTLDDNIIINFVQFYNQHNLTLQLCIRHLTSRSCDLSLGKV